MSQPIRDPSFEVHPGLQEELLESQGPGVTSGDIPVESSTMDVLQASTDDSSLQKPNTLQLSPEARTWAEQELDFDNLPIWKYDYFATDEMEPLIMPEGNGYVFVNIERYGANIEKLYQAKLALLNSGELTPSGENIGAVMELVAVPWKAFRDNLDRLPDFVESKRNARANASEDFLHPDLVEAITNGSKMYRNPIAGHVTKAANGTQEVPNWMSAAEYLDHRISQDGNWGLMLVQTSREAGIKRLLDGPEEQRSPDALTNNGQEEFMLVGQNFGQLGEFEWLSLSLHVENLSDLSPNDFSFMLANRVESSNGPLVPIGCSDNDWLGSGLIKASRNNADSRPRLALL